MSSDDDNDPGFAARFTRRFAAIRVDEPPTAAPSVAELRIAESLLAASLPPSVSGIREIAAGRLVRKDKIWGKQRKSQCVSNLDKASRMREKKAHYLS